MATTQLITLVAETSIHAGAGSSSGYIDLPVQREAHTDWPCIYGSGVKGALRAAATLNANGNSNDVLWLFGPETGNTDSGAGALIVTDARLLLLPVRSLTSHYRWVTCPALLQRLAADLKRLRMARPLPASGAPTASQALVAEAVEGGALYLDEINFAAETAPLADLCAALSQLTGLAVADLVAKLAVIHDDRFAYLARYSTPVSTHVKLTEKKTVETGALWTEESLPPDTVMYVGAHLAMRASLAPGVGITRLNELSFPDNYLQIGGNETVGMGFCRTHTVTA